MSGWSSVKPKDHGATGGAGPRRDSAESIPRPAAFAGMKFPSTKSPRTRRGDVNQLMIGRRAAAVGPTAQQRSQMEAVTNEVAKKPWDPKKRMSYFAAFKPPSLSDMPLPASRRKGARLPSSRMGSGQDQAPVGTSSSESTTVDLPPSPERDEADAAASAAPMLVEYTAIVGLGPNPDVENRNDNPLYARYKASILDRLPRTNRSGAPLPPHMSMGIALRQEMPDEKEPEFFIFVLTEIDGARFYGACLVQYEEVNPSVLETLGSSPGTTLYAPKCLCVLSHHPYFLAYRQCLFELHSNMRASQPRFAVEYLLSLMQSIPLPPLGYEVRVAFGDRQLSLKRSGPTEIPLLQFSFTALFQAIGVENVVKLFGHAIFERKICFFSKHKTLLTTAAEILVSLLSPFQWPHVYIPILPRSLLDILQAPTPYIIGIHTSYFIEASEVDDVVFVDLDNGKLHSPHPDKIPDDLFSVLVDTVKKCMSSAETTSRTGSPVVTQARASPAVVTPALARKMQSQFLGNLGEHEAAVQLAVREQFLLFFVRLMASFSDSFLYLRRFPTPIAIFNKATFLRSRTSVALAELANSFVETQLFFVFLDDYQRPTGLFDELVAAQAMRAGKDSSSALEKVVVRGRRGHQKKKKLVVIPDSTQIAVSANKRYSLLSEEERLIRSNELRFPNTDSVVLDDIMDQLSELYAPNYEETRVLSQKMRESLSTWNNYLCGLEKSNLGKMKDAKNFASMTAKDAAATEFIEKRVRQIVSASPITGGNLKLLMDLFQLDHGRILFAEILCSVAEGDPISHQAYELLADIVLAALSACLLDADFDATTKLMQVGTMFWCVDETTIEQVFLYERTKTHEIWKNRHFWEAAFFEAIAIGRDSLGVRYTSHQNAFEALPVTEQEELLETEERLIFDVLGGFIDSMLKYGLSSQAVTLFVCRLANLSQLQDERTDTLETLVQNLALAQERRAGVQTVHELQDEFGQYFASTFSSPKGMNAGNIKELYQRLMEVERVSQHAQGKVVQKKHFLDLSMRNSAALENIPELLQAQFAAAEAGPNSASARHCKKLPTQSFVETNDSYEVRVLKGHTTAVLALAVDRTIVASASSTGAVMIWDATTGNCHRQIFPHSDRVTALAFNEDNLVSGGLDQRIVVSDTQTGDQKGVLHGHSGSISSLELRDALVVSGSFDNTVKIWDFRNSRTPVASFSGHSGAIADLAYDGCSMLVSGSRDTSIRLWDLRKGRTMRTFAQHNDWISGLRLGEGAFGKHFVSSSFDGTLRLWNLKTMDCEHTFRGHRGSVNCFESTGSMLASGSGDNDVRLWDLDSGQCVQCFRGHTEEVSGVGFLPDGKVVSGGYDGTVRLWTEGRSKQEVLCGHTDWITGLHCYRGTIVTSSLDRDVRVWRPEKEQTDDQPKRKKTFKLGNKIWN